MDPAEEDEQDQEAADFWAHLGAAEPSSEAPPRQQSQQEGGGDLDVPLAFLVAAKKAQQRVRNASDNAAVAAGASGSSAALAKSLRAGGGTAAAKTQRPRARPKAADVLPQRRRRDDESSASSSSSSSSPGGDGRASSAKTKVGTGAAVETTRGPTQLVRDLVRDYVEGQADLPNVVAKPDTSSFPARARSRATQDPMHLGNRSDYIWVVECSPGAFTHVPEDAADTAPPVERQQASRACGACGVFSKAARYQLRCYRRGQAEEASRPRSLRPETYCSCAKCMRVLMGAAPVQPVEHKKRVDQLRSQLQAALRSKRLEPHRWLEPLRRLPAAEAGQCRSVLHGELARIVAICMKADAAWRKLGTGEVLAANGSRAAGPRGSPSVADTRATCRDIGLRSRSVLFGSELRPYGEEETLPTAGGRSPPAPHEQYMVAFSRSKAQGQQSTPYVVAVFASRRPERLKASALAFLRRQGVSQRCIEVWVSPAEQDLYREALAKDWPQVTVRAGVHGLMEQRWHALQQYKEGTHLVCLDDDVVDVLHKFQAGTGAETMQPLASGGFEALIRHAHGLMLQEGAYLWGGCSSSHPADMAVACISRRCGLVNGFFYGMRVPKDPEVFQCLYGGAAAEDVERSCRVFSQHGVILRYLMYAAKVSFQATEDFAPATLSAAEKMASEELALKDLAAEFPKLLAVAEGSSEVAATWRMHAQIGRPPLIPNTSSSPAASSSSSEAWRTGSDAAHASEAPWTEAERQQAQRRAQQEKAILGRCIVLQQGLDRAVLGEVAAQWAGADSSRRAGSSSAATAAAKVSSGSSAPAAAAAFMVPEVLETVMHIASPRDQTRTFGSLGLVAARPDLEFELGVMVALPERKAERASTAAAAPAEAPAKKNSAQGKEGLGYTGARRQDAWASLVNSLSVGPDADSATALELSSLSVKARSVDAAMVAAGRKALLAPSGFGPRRQVEESARMDAEIEEAGFGPRQLPLGAEPLRAKPPAPLPEEIPDTVPKLEAGQKPAKVPRLPVAAGSVAAMKVKTFKDEAPEDMDDAASSACFEFTCFMRPKLNTRFALDDFTQIRGRPSFWDQSRSIFVYWQDKRQRWAVAQRWDKGEDLLDKVRKGEEVGWAYQRSATVWKEFWQGTWQLAEMSEPIPLLVDAAGGEAPVPSVPTVPAVPDLDRGSLTAEELRRDSKATVKHNLPMLPPRSDLAAKGATAKAAAGPAPPRIGPRHRRHRRGPEPPDFATGKRQKRSLHPSLPPDQEVEADARGKEDPALDELRFLAEETFTEAMPNLPPATEPFSSEFLLAPPVE
eukprot:TRINITY_DN111581_c0_g1_i1.p1 TRINITY_DN111581_c0_g1~~TRINITY_DN111581_c0_g1_i1.p1  ORF type:complete len:1305 (+),score=325.23 TRINITY_DN111581_c0_g1_i1:67-3981(+)